MTDRTRPTPPEEPEFLRNQMALLAVPSSLAAPGCPFRQLAVVRTVEPTPTKGATL